MVLRSDALFEEPNPAGTVRLDMRWKRAARGLLHELGGLATLRLVHRGKFRVLMFHEFEESLCKNLDLICEYISRNYEPVTLSAIAAAIHSNSRLPTNALTVTVDDGYRNFLSFGHSIFKKHGISTTVYAVTGFADGRLWLWTDQVAFILEQTTRRAFSVEVEKGKVLDLDLSSATSRSQATRTLWEALKEVPNQRRLEFLTSFASLCRVEIPPLPPAEWKPLSWDELRALAADGVEVGCHTDTHPILSRLSDHAELEREIGGAKEVMEARLKRRVDHFCYPNGREIDISEAAVACVRKAGFASSVTCSYGLNTLKANPLRIMRLPVETGQKVEYTAEVLVGFHLR
jgi:peptidoglycan/xylan/chitin deacetylase (PgdA/CDA1 family)